MVGSVGIARSASALLPQKLNGERGEQEGGGGAERESIGHTHPRERRFNCLQLRPQCKMKRSRYRERRSLSGAVTMGGMGGRVLCAVPMAKPRVGGPRAGWKNTPGRAPPVHRPPTRPGLLNCSSTRPDRTNADAERTREILRRLGVTNPFLSISLFSFPYPSSLPSLLTDS